LAGLSTAPLRRVQSSSASRARRRACARRTCPRPPPRE
jgi:hypothetical protein